MGDIVFVAGARPNFMKLAPILRELARRGQVRGTLVHTGQHHGHEMSGRVLRAAPHAGARRPPRGRICQPRRPDRADQGRVRGVPRGTSLSPAGGVVGGDVNSTTACALVAVKRGIPVAHVEAGLRSFDRTMPEEINRIVTDQVSDLLLVSEPAGLDNLAREGVLAERIHYCGNVMIDSLVDQLPAARALDMPAYLGVTRGAYAVATLHRPSNVDAPGRLRALLGFLERLGAELPVVFPIHPRTDKMLGDLGLRDALALSGRIRPTAPLGYREFLGLMDGARLVVTDSGGIQEETTYLGVPCVTLRANTERPVTVTHGTNTLVGEDLSGRGTCAWPASTAHRDRPSQSTGGKAQHRPGFFA